MGAWNAFYVGAQNDAAVVAIRKRFSDDMEIESSPVFLGVRMPDDAFEPPAFHLAALSAHLATDVFWLGFQSVVDAFQFHHWRSGQYIRALVYGAFQERTWERVDGEAEPWEREVLFSPRKLEQALDCAVGDCERDELRRIWRDAEISPRRSEPWLDSRACAHKIARYYHFPHYGL